MSALTNQVIKGFEFHGCIGQGHIGAVYLAHQAALKRDVAIKVIHPQYANHPEFVRRFEADAQLVARLEHPHLVPLYDYWRDPGCAYLVTRWLPDSLGLVLADGPWPVEAAVRLLEQLAAALSMVHRHEVIHGDIKPANVLLDEDRNAYLADLSTARLRESLSGEAGRSVSAYTAPEQIRNEPATPQTDIYGLGMVLYETLAGERPFVDAVTTDALAYKHLHEALPALKARRPDVPPALDAVLHMATAKSAGQRYPDVDRFAAAFRAAVPALPRPRQQPLPDPLTDRELEILGLIADGWSSQNIMHRLFLSAATVKWYLHQIYGKLNVHSRAQAIECARLFGLIAEPEASRTPSTPGVVMPTPPGMTAERLRNPYKGLHAFQEADAADFFGRTALTDRLLNRLSEPAAEARFLVVAGPSGSGKSSAVKAGLIPALRRGELPGAERWFLAEMTPGTHPFEELEAALLRVAVNAPPGLLSLLCGDARGLTRAVKQILPGNDAELVLVIDQFEEAFTLVEDESTRQRFFDSLVAAACDTRSRVRLILTLRADFYDRPLLYPGLAELVRTHTELVLPLSPAELAQVITGPPEQVGIDVESGLVDLIVKDVGQQPGALPLLEYALTELFDQREDHKLTLSAYRASGGVPGALARRADELYAGLGSDGQAVARQLFLRLVTLGEGTEDTRRRVLQSELAMPGGGERDLEEVLELFGQYRLLTFDRDPITRGPTVEVAHEALIRTWARLRQWLDDSREDLYVHRRLTTATAEWARTGQDASFLAGGTRLAQFEALVAKATLALNAEERAYLAASIAERDRREAEERARQTRELTLQRVLVVVLLVATIGALGLSVFAFGQRDVARRNAAVNRSLVLANDAQKAFEAGNVDLALPLALEAVKIEQPPASARQTLAEVAYGPGTRMNLQLSGDKITDLAIGPDGKTILAATCGQSDAPTHCRQGQLVLWNLQGQAISQRLDGHAGWATAVTFSPDGKTALSGSDDKTLILWDVSTGLPIRRFEGHSGGVTSLAFSPDGKTALSGSDDRTLILRDASTGQPIRRLEGHISGVTSLALNPDGKTVVSGAKDGLLILWDVGTGTAIRQFKGHTSDVTGIVFAPDGRSIISTGDISIRHWDVGTGAPLHEPANLVVVPYGLAITPDGRRVLFTRANSVVLWDVTRWQADFTLALSGLNLLNNPGDSSKEWDMLSALAVGPSGHLLVAATAWGQVSAANLDMQSITYRVLPEGIPLSGLAVSPDGRRLLFGTSTGELVVWDVAQHQAVRRFKATEVANLGVSVLAYLPDGRMAMAGLGNWAGKTDIPLLELVDTETGQVIRQFTGHPYNVRSLAVSPDGKTVLSGSQSYVSGVIGFGDLILWDIETGQIIRRFDTGYDTTDIVFSADGRRAITSSVRDPNVNLWDVATGKIIRSYSARVQHFFQIAFGPAEKTILAAGGDPALQLWDAETGQIIRTYTGHDGTAVWELAISPDKRLVVSRDNKGQLILWDFESGRLLRRLGYHPWFIHSLKFSRDGQVAYSVSTNGTLVEWQIVDPPLDKLIEWIKANRLIREFTPDERAQYEIEPLCR